MKELKEAFWKIVDTVREFLAPPPTPIPVKVRRDRDR